MLISQGSLDRMLHAAGDAWQRADFPQCFELLERATLLNPSNHKILLGLGQFYGLRYDFAAAERCFDKAIRVAPKKAGLLAMAGHLSAEFGNYPMAERYFHQALEHPDAAPETFARLAELYERLHRKEDAAAMVDRALRMNGSCALAWLIRAKLDRQENRLVEAEQSLRHVLLSTDRNIRVRGYYELGANLDRQGRYDEAMNAFIEAKTLLRPDAPPLLAQSQLVAANLDRMQNDISAEMLQRWFDSGRAELQPFHRLAFLGGFARSGTTLLEQVLDSHPDIVSAEETDIFQTDAYAPLRRSLGAPVPILSGLEMAQTDALRRSRENYFRSMGLHFGKPVGNRLLIDKNPTLQALIPVIVRIFPEIKLLIAIRDPRDVCLSCFMQPHLPLSNSSVTFLNLEDTVKTYVRVMEIWRTLRPILKNPFLEVRYEDMVDDLESVARRSLDFLEVPWDARVLGFDEHARKKLVRSPTYSDVTQKVYKRARGRWRNYEKYLAPHLEKLEPFVKGFGYE